MVLIGLLLIALVCLALGLVLASAGWLIGSLAASAAAAWVLWRGRDRIVPAGAAAEHAADTPPLASAAPQVANSVATSAPSRDAAVAETPAAADYARRRADELSGAAAAQPALATATAAGAGIAAGAELVDFDVWVIDGRPNYHAAHCGVLLGADAETIPHSQAVEDGFTPCTLCDPDAHPERVASPAQTGPASAVPEATAPGDLRQVWVVDGWPHYHAQSCTRLVGAASEPVPFGQAVEDGFTACPDCQPAVIEPAVQPQSAAAPDPVAVPEPIQPEPVATQIAAPAAAPEPILEPAAEPGPVTEPEPAAAPAAESALVAESAPVAEPEPAAAAEGAPAAPEPAASGTRDVWVVPGRPRFHMRDCMIIGDQDAVAVPLEQALDDGFKPCSLCEPAG